MIGIGSTILRKRLIYSRQDLVLPVSGRTSGTPTNGTITFSATADLTVEATGSVVIVSTTRANDALFGGVQLRVHTVVISCPNNESGTLIIKRADRIRSFGNHRGTNNPNVNFYAGTDASMPIVSWNLNNLPALTQKITQPTLTTALPTTGNKALPTGLTFLYLSGSNINWTYTGALPTGLTYLYLDGNNIHWTYTGALPTGLTYLYLSGSNINWTYTGALPTGLTFLLLSGNNIHWTYTGALPTGLTFLYLLGNNINWTYTGALPTGLTYLVLLGNNINWTHTGALPTGLTLLYLSGNNINWTGNILGNTGSPKPNMTSLQLLDYRAGTNTMDYVDLIPLLNSVLNNTGTLPTTVIIREQIAANVTAIAAATADEFGTDAEQAKYLINSIKSTKGVSTFTLNTTNI